MTPSECIGTEYLKPVPRAGGAFFQGISISMVSVVLTLSRAV